MSRTPALEYLAHAYEEAGYKAVALALRKHGANAEKFKVELQAIELAIAATREEAARLADLVDNSGRAGRAVRTQAFSV